MMAERGRLRRSPARRVQWGLVDQAISSFTNFAITILVARIATPRDFGAFSLAMTLYLFLLWVSRSVTTDPFVVRLTPVSAEQQQAAAVQVSGAALSLGAVTGLAIFLVGFIAEPHPPLVFGAMAISMPALITQDSFRYVLIAGGRARSAALNDFLWLLVQSCLALAFVRFRYGSVPALVVAFGCGAGIAALVGARQTGVVPSPASCWGWFRQHRDLAIPFVIEHVAVTGAVQLAILAVAASAGVIVVGELRAAMLLLGPLTVVFVGLFVVVLPEAVRLRQRSFSLLTILVIVMGVLMPLITLLWAGVVSFLPDPVGLVLMGANWFAGRGLLLPVAAIVAGNSSASAAVIGLRALGAAKQSLRARLCGTPVMLVAGVLGSSLAGAHGAAVGIAGATWLDALLAWGAYGRAVRRAARPRG